MVDKIVDKLFHLNEDIYYKFKEADEQFLQDVDRPYLKLIEVNENFYAIPLRSIKTKYNSDLFLEIGDNSYLDFSKHFQVLDKNIFQESNMQITNLDNNKVIKILENAIFQKQKGRIRFPVDDFKLLNIQRNYYLKAYLDSKGLPTNGKDKFLCLNKEHNDTAPSMNYNPKLNNVKCFSCGESYNFINLVKHEYGLEYKEAIKVVDNLIKNNFSDIKIDYSIARSSIKTEVSQEMLEKAEKSVKKFALDIEKTDYLTNRGISMETQKKLNIGYNAKYNQAILPVGKDYYISRNIEKYINKSGVELRYVYMKDREIPITPPMNIAPSNDGAIFITEGYIDAISLVELDETAISLNGANNTSKEALKEYIDIFAKKVVLALDNDNAGLRAEQKIIDIIEDINKERVTKGVIESDLITYSKLELGQYNDVNDALVKNRLFLQNSIYNAKGIKTVPIELNNNLEQELSNMSDNISSKRQQDLLEATRTIEAGVNKVFNSNESFKSGLDMISDITKMNNYSLNNVMLLKEQIERDPLKSSNPPLCKTMKQWNDEGIRINKGSKALSIIKPQSYSLFTDENNNNKLVSKATDQEKQLIASGQIKPFQVDTYRVAKELFHFTDTNLDISAYHNQTIFNNIENIDVGKEYDDLRAKVESQGVPVIERNIGLPAGKLVADEVGNTILINSNLDDAHKLKTLLHEITHYELEHIGSDLDIHAKELEAESIAYLTSKDLGLDTSNYSFKYLANWSKDRNSKELSNILENIKDKYMKISNKYINNNPEQRKELVQSKQQENEINQEQDDFSNVKKIAGKKLSGGIDIE